MGGSMTAISLGQSARPGRLGIRTITAIKVSRIPRESGRYLVGSAQLREQFEMGNIASRPQEFVGGSVDFLLGRRPPSSMIILRYLAFTERRNPTTGIAGCCARAASGHA